MVRSLISQYIKQVVRAMTTIVLIVGLGACVTQSQSFWDTDRISELRESMATGNLDQAEYLIERYDNTLSNNMALDIGIREGNVDAVKHFIHLSEVNQALDSDGVTPLIRAVQEAPTDSREKIIRSLLDAGADPSINDNFGRNASNYAAFSGDLRLSDFLESQGDAFYSSQPAERTAWLPEVDVDQALYGPDTNQPRSRKKKPSLLSRSPLRRSTAGRPDLLFASTWIPQISDTDAGPYAGLRFHADGTGDVQIFPQAERIEADGPSLLAWDYHRDDLYFMVLNKNFASYCKSVDGGPGRFGVNCTDYAAAGNNIQAALNSELSAESAKNLLNNASARARLQEVGKTNSVLEPAVDKFCKPIRASKKLRRGKAKRAASNRKPGDWVVFDARRFATYSAENELVCTQREARRAAFDICKGAGGNCRSVGGCSKGEATVVASVQGHDWAWLGCDADIEYAKILALQECSNNAGCDCQVVYSSDRIPEGPDAVCRPRRRS